MATEPRTISEILQASYVSGSAAIRASITDISLAVSAASEQDDAGQLRTSSIQGDAGLLLVSSKQGDAGLLLVSSKQGDAGLLRVSGLQLDGANLRTSALQADAGLQRVSGIQDDGANLRVSTLQGNSYVNIALSAQTTVKSGAGFLHGIQFNADNISSVRLYDNTVSGGTVIATIGPSAMTALGFFQYDLNFGTGLTISSGSSNTDITVMYQ